MLALRFSALLCLAPLSCEAALPGAAGPTWHGIVDIAAGRGECGPWQQNDSRYDYVDDPTVALDAVGEAAVAWVDQGRKEVLIQRFSLSGKRRFTAPIAVSRSPATFSWLPRLAFGRGSPEPIYVLWQEIIFSGGSHGGDILFARSLDGGATFSPPLNLSRSQGGDGKGRINEQVWHNGSHDLAVGPDGALYATWTEYHGALWLSRSRDGGATFSPPVRIAGTPERPARGPSLAVGGDGAIYLAWTVGEDASADIRLTRATDGGATFAPPRVVAASPTYSDAPKLAVAPDKALHLVFAESTGGPFAPHRVRYTRSTDGGRSFAPPRELAAQLPEGFVSAAFPALALDALGRLAVLWELFEAGQSRPAALAMTTSTDGGRTFAEAALVPYSRAPAGGLNGSQQGLLMEKLAVNSDGALAIVNSSLKPGESSRIWLIRGQLPNAADRRP